MPTQVQKAMERQLALWQAQLALAREEPWLAGHLLRQSVRLQQQLAQLSRRLLVLLSLACSRRWWQRFKKALPALVAGGALLLALGLTAPSAKAANFMVTTTADTVGDDGVTSLREAITLANASPGDDTIDMTTVSGTIGLGSDLPDITESAQFNGPGPDNLTIDGGGASNGLYGTGSETNIGVDGLTIINVSNFGIAAYNSATVSNSTVTGGEVGVGARGDVTVSNSTVTGGFLGVEARKDATVTNSTISGSYFGIEADENATVTYSTVTGGMAGVTAVNEGTVTDSTISGIENGVAVSGHTKVTRSTITATGGDGIWVLGDATVTNSTITGCGAYGIGDTGIPGGTLRVSHSTISGNSLHGIAHRGTVFLNNSIVAGNNAGGPDLLGPFDNATSGYNLIGNGDGSGLTHGVNGNQLGTAGALLNPRLGPLDDNGGFTKTQALLEDSPAIDAANPDTCPGIDQRGYSRPHGFGCDIGSFEYGSTDTDGYRVTSDLWIRAVINSEEKGPIEAVWQKGGEDNTSRGDQVIWGHFYASPSDVNWGSANNPDLYVKIWFDAGGRLDVNFFHVSVPDIVVYSDYIYDGTADEQGTTTMDTRYIRHYYDNGESNSEEQTEDGNPPAGTSPSGNPTGYSTINDLRIGAIINTEEIGPIEALWQLGGTDTTAAGDQVVWGHFYASPDDVTWGSEANPDLFVKVWFDNSGRIDVNFFHVSVPDIEVYSDYPSDGSYNLAGTTIMSNRYIRQEYQR